MKLKFQINTIYIENVWAGNHYPYFIRIIIENKIRANFHLPGLALNTFRDQLKQL
jgi:hypothetical protein